MEAIISLLWLPFTLLVLIADVVAIIGICRSQESPGVKVAWSAGVFLFPMLGLIAWAIAGPRRVRLAE